MPMRNLVAVLLCAGVVACVSDHEALRNDQGQVVNCNNEGWGWLGAPVAMANQSDCIKKAEAAGFHRPGVADTATAPPKQATTAQNALPSPTDAPHSLAPVTATSTAVTPVSNPAVNASPPVGSTADRLRKLDDLFKAGLITKDEYDRKRQEILATF